MSYILRKNYLTPNKWSRPQRKMSPEWIVLHWEAVVNARADSVRNYFENRKYGKTGYGSAHEVIDTNGDILLMIPKDEMAYHVGSKSYTTYKERMMGNTYPNAICYGIETPTTDMKGTIDKHVYDVIVDRITDLLIEFNLPYNKVATHGMITGKDCHKYFNPSWNEIDWKRWDLFMNDIHDMYVKKINGNNPSTLPKILDIEIESEIIEDIDTDTLLKLSKHLPNYTYLLYRYCGYDLKRGDKNDDVGKLQIPLKELGYYNMDIDKSFGAGTEKALYNFCKPRNIWFGGKVTENIAKAINKAMNEQL